MVAADIVEFQRGAAKRDRLLAIDHLVRITTSGRTRSASSIRADVPSRAGAQ